MGNRSCDAFFKLSAHACSCNDRSLASTDPLKGATPLGMPPENSHISKNRDERILVAQHEKMLQWWSRRVPMLHAHATACSSPATASLAPLLLKAHRMHARINLRRTMRQRQSGTMQQHALGDAIHGVVSLNRLEIIRSSVAVAESSVLHAGLSGQRIAFQETNLLLGQCRGLMPTPQKALH